MKKYNPIKKEKHKNKDFYFLSGRTFLKIMTYYV